VRRNSGRGRREDLQPLLLAVHRLWTDSRRPGSQAVDRLLNTVAAVAAARLMMSFCLTCLVR